MGTISNSTGWQQAANYLLSGLDDTIDPCQDFYAFTCNKYLASIASTKMLVSSKGTAADAQVQVNQLIAAALKDVNSSDENVSLTERIMKRALDSCIHDFTMGEGDHFVEINKEIIDLFGGVPFNNGALRKDIDLMGIAGILEQNHALGTLMFSWVSVDYKNIQNNALYISQPDLDMPHDYFVKPQFIDQLTQEQENIFSIMKMYQGATVGNVTDDQLHQAAEDVVNFEVLIAMASWSDELQRNYKQQYNRYNLDDLNTTYPNLNWKAYLNGLLNGTQTAIQIQQDGVVISQPSYFGWLDSIFNEKIVDRNTIANYMIIQLLQDDGGFWGGQMRQLMVQKDYVPYIWRRGKGVTRLGRRYTRQYDNSPIAVMCIDALLAYMPYGPGFVYVKSQTDREEVVKDVGRQMELIISNFQGMMHTLSWMDEISMTFAINKSNSLLKNYGWPRNLFGDFQNTSVLDSYHKDYSDILKYDVDNFYNILKILKQGMVVREALRLLNPEDNEVWGNNRANFFQSPAMVNAWYQPERNSITIPFAAWNPPYYRLDFPQAFNFAGQGGVGGHELTHGFDDEGVQFDWDGSLAQCNGRYKCSWLDASSNDGFTDMAQCTVAQYSSQCCPLKTGNVHCANGATTQGENIADIGGQQAAYLAYRQFVEQQGQEELRLPGMSQYTPNQVFWITYGYSWCIKQTDQSLTKQLLTNAHAPAQCRTNQVVQDIPHFGRDFNCRQGSPMYPLSDQRCKVWVGL